MAQIQQKSLQRKTHEQRTELSDRLMLEAAIKLILEKGTHKTTLKEVGELAGYSRSMAGYRFGTKAGLFEFIIRAVGEQWLERLVRVSKSKNGFAALSAALDEHCSMCLEAPDAIRVFYILWFESIGVQSPAKQMIAKIHARRREDVKAWVKQAWRSSKNTQLTINAETIASQFNASVLGIAYFWLANPQDKNTIKNLHNSLKYSMQLHFT